MLRCTLLRHLCGVALTALVLGLPAASYAQTGYTIVDLGTLGGTDSDGESINASGQVTGSYYLPGIPARHAVVWTYPFAYDLNTLDEYNSVGYGINVSGQVAGWSDMTGTIIQHAVRWTGTTAEDLDTLGGDYSYGRAINDSGQVAGSSCLVGDVAQHAVVWTGTTATDLGTLGGTDSWGSGINNSGQVTGWAETAGSGAKHTFRYSGSTMTDLGTLGGTNSGGYAINANGQVAGYSYLAGDTAYHAVVWIGTTATDLGTLGGANSYGFGINSFGGVVGYSDTLSGAMDAFLYSGGRMMDLNDLLPANSGWQLANAVSINDSGWITGTGSHNLQPHAYLLVPIHVIVSGYLSLEGVVSLYAISPAPPLGTFHISFRTPDTTTEVYGADVTLTTMLHTVGGTYTVPNVPLGMYDIAIQGSKNLRVVIPNVTINGNITLPDVTLPAGDANNDNSVDIADFGVLVGAYGSKASDPTSGYDPTADFNFDGKVDVADFSLLVNEYGNVGAL